jgi:hypothetical protein
MAMYEVAITCGGRIESSSVYFGKKSTALKFIEGMKNCPSNDDRPDYAKKGAKIIGSTDLLGAYPLDDERYSDKNDGEGEYWHKRKPWQQKK